jgi:ubiquinol-cytochrome c reductase cytochrome b subunit
MGGYFFTVFGVLALMGATMTINAVWNYGPYDPSPVSAGAQPDWYMLFLEGALRIMPGGAEVVIAGFTIPFNVIVPAMIVPGILLGAFALYPFIEAFATGDKSEHHVVDRPRNVPVRTALGVAFLSELILLALGGSNDLIATHFDLSINAITNAFRVLFFVLPVVAFVVTKRICLGLQRRDREIALHGRETGTIVRFASGEYIEVHKPVDDHERWVLVSYEAPRPLEIEPAEDARGVRRRGYRFDRLRQRVSRFFYEDRIEAVTPAELAAAQSHGAHDTVAAAHEGAAELAGVGAPPAEVGAAGRGHPTS